MPNQSRITPVVRPLSVPARLDLGDWISPANACGGLLASAISVLNTKNPKAIDDACQNVAEMVALVQAMIDFKSMVSVENPSLVSNTSEVGKLDDLSAEVLGLCSDVLSALLELRAQSAQSGTEGFNAEE